MGTSLDDPTHFKEWIEAEGFEGVVEKKLKIPSNPWPKDPRLKLIGAFEFDNLVYGLEGMSMRLFQKGLGWSAQETSVFCAGVRKDIGNKRYHAYYPL